LGIFISFGHAQNISEETRKGKRKNGIDREKCIYYGVVEEKLKHRG
jgi:hypothetical protein